MGGWGGFIAHTAVRKVVYVLVGLALAAVLAASGVKAADTLTFTRSGAFSYGGTYTADTANPFTVTAGGVYRVKVYGFGGGSLNLGVSYNGSGCTLACDAWYTGPEHVFTAPTSATSAYVIGRNNGGANLIGSSWQAFTVTADPAPTSGLSEVSCGLVASPVPSSTPNPSYQPCHVVIDNAGTVADTTTTVLVYGFGLVIFVTSVAAVAVGLRR